MISAWKQTECLLIVHLQMAVSGHVVEMSTL